MGRMVAHSQLRQRSSQQLSASGRSHRTVNRFVRVEILCGIRGCSPFCQAGHHAVSGLVVARVIDRPVLDLLQLRDACWSLQAWHATVSKVIQHGPAWQNGEHPRTGTTRSKFSFEAESTRRAHTFSKKNTHSLVLVWCTCSCSACEHKCVCARHTSNATTKPSTCSNENGSCLMLTSGVFCVCVCVCVCVCAGVCLQVLSCPNVPREKEMVFALPRMLHERVAETATVRSDGASPPDQRNGSHPQDDCFDDKTCDRMLHHRASCDFFRNCAQTFHSAICSCPCVVVFHSGPNCTCVFENCVVLVVIQRLKCDRAFAKLFSCDKMFAGIYDFSSLYISRVLLCTLLYRFTLYRLQVFLTSPSCCVLAFNTTKAGHRQYVPIGYQKFPLLLRREHDQPKPLTTMCDTVRP